MPCSPGRALPAGKGWVLEPKWDGIRAIAHVTEQGLRLFTRHVRGHHDRFQRINVALAQLPVGTVRDGELACLQPLTDGPGALPLRSRHRVHGRARPTARTRTVSPSPWSSSTRSLWRAPTCALTSGATVAPVLRSCWPAPTGRAA
jgi:hypothetical protein